MKMEKKHKIINKIHNRT